MGWLIIIGGPANTAESWGGAALAVLAAPLDPPLSGAVERGWCWVIKRNTELVMRG